jgi:glutathione S-transferase
MKLYYSPGACSLSPHIVGVEAGIHLELERVDLRSKKTASGGDFLAVNPKGYVPALALDDGSILTEGPTIVQYLADQRPDAKLAPPAGTMARYRLQEALGFINSELHRTYTPLFSKDITAEYRKNREAYLLTRYAAIEQQLEGRPYLLGDTFTVADAYLFTVTRWAPMVKVDLSHLPNLTAFQKRVEARPHVQEALRSQK